MQLTSVFYVLLAVAAGMAIPVQAAINGQLARVLGSTFAAAMVSFGVGALVLMGLSLLSVREWPSTSALKLIPLYVFLAGGVLGVLFVSSNVFLVPRIGAAMTISFVIAGQLLSAVLIDHFGLWGVLARESSVGRMFGLVLVLIGAIMVRVL